MKYVISGSLGNISKPLATQLAKEGHDVTVISSKESKRAAIEAIGAKAAIGSVEDAEFLAKTFKGADVVYTMVPPNFEADDWKGYIAHIGQNYADAIRQSGVKKVVHLSSMGAHMATGAGPVSGIHRVEEALNKLEGVDVVHLRPAFFYNNFFGNIGMIKQMNIIGGNYGEHNTVYMTAPKDIAAVAVQQIKNPTFTGKTILYILSDTKTTDEVAKVLGTAVGKPQLPWINFSDEDALKGMLGAGLPQEIASNYVEMGHGLAVGEMQSDIKKHMPTLSPTKLEDFAKEFAGAYNN